MTTATFIAPAKLTLGLHITGVRPDGYHEIDAIMTTLDLHDSLTIEELGEEGRPASSVVYTGPFSAGLSGDGDDLVSRALAACERHARITVHKAIPHGGGLGGGSADAAAVFRWAGVDDLTSAHHRALMASVGADVPFCVHGGRARVRGIGEVVEPIAHQPGTVTLVIPPLSVSTPLAYRAWDELGGPSHPTNDLEPAAMVVEPRLAEWKQRITRATGVEPILAGSGATWFVHGDHTSAAHELGDALVIATQCR